MINVDNIDVVKNCSDSSVYAKGIELYNQGKIINFMIYGNGMMMEAIVQDDQRYNVRIGEVDGRLRVYCTCSGFKRNRGLCQHLVATLFYYKDYNNAEGKITRQLFEVFQESDDSIAKIPVNLEVTLEVGDEFTDDCYVGMSLRIGEDRLYVVRNIKKLLSSIREGETLNFGKNFTFDPEYHCFKEEDMPIIDFLNEVYEIDDISRPAYLSYYYGNRCGLFAEKYFLFTPSLLGRFLRLFEGRTFKVNLYGKIYDSRFFNADIPVDFKLDKDNEDMVLDISDLNKIYPLTADGRYLFFDGNIYGISKEQSETLAPFYNTIVQSGVDKIRFKEWDKQKFATIILPRIEGVGTVSIDEKIKPFFYKEPLQTRIYFDKEGDMITADINFVYGDYVINPFNPKSNVIDGKNILIRDLKGEGRIIRIFERAEFNLKDGRIYLSGDDQIYNFINNTLPEMQKYAEIYYSEEFKNIKVYNSRYYTGGIRLNEGTDLLEFSFSIEGVDKNLLSDIFKSLKLKKRYYRLPDGGFIPLDSPELQSVYDMINSLDIDEEQLKKDVIKLPKYRALYLDEKLKDSGISVERNLPFKQLVQNIKEPQDMDYEVPKELQGVLRKYQITGYRWLKTLAHYGFGGILADDMGLGKTIQTIAFILSERENRAEPVLVICPTSLVYNWESEIKRFAPSLKTFIISGSKDERENQIEKISEADVVITSYPLIRRDIDSYKNIEFSYCIIDEAQHIKNPNSQNAKAVKEIKARGHFALTGTPIENSLTELWSIFDFVMPGYLSSHRKFVEKYERPIVKNQDKNALEDLSKHIKPFILRRVKKDVLKELPQKIETSLKAELTREQKLIYMAYLEKIKGEIESEIKEKGFEKSQIKIISGITRLRQICCHPSLFIQNYEGESGKMELLMELLQELKEGGHRTLLFSQFTSALRLIQERLDKEGISHLYLDGETKPEDRGPLIRAFNSGQGDVFLISLKAGGTGLNLTSADTVIHFDPWWNPAVEDQATDRAHRIGQKNTVQVFKLITIGTIEEKILELQNKKKEIIKSVINPGETFLTGLSQEEIMYLFEA